MLKDRTAPRKTTVSIVSNYTWVRRIHLFTDAVPSDEDTASDSDSSYVPDEKDADVSMPTASLAGSSITGAASLDLADAPIPLDPAEENGPIVEAAAAAVQQDVDTVLADAEASNYSAEDSSEEDATAPTTAKPSGLFSREGIPKLEEYIPLQYFPDTLIVHDPNGLSMCCDGRSYESYDPKAPDYTDDEDGQTYSETNADQDDDAEKQPAFVYKRVYPAPTTTPDDEKKTAHLYMSPQHRSGVGHHSHVYLSPLTLPTPLTTYKRASARPGTVLVAAKLAVQQRNARQLLASEAATYASFPRHLSEEYCGFHLLSPFMQALSPSCAAVPKFYG